MIAVHDNFTSDDCNTGLLVHQALNHWIIWPLDIDSKLNMVRDDCTTG